MTHPPKNIIPLIEVEWRVQIKMIEICRPNIATKDDPIQPRFFWIAQGENSGLSVPLGSTRGQKTERYAKIVWERFARKNRFTKWRFIK